MELSVDFLKIFKRSYYIQYIILDSRTVDGI